jgi:hypothetical protein
MHELYPYYDEGTYYSRALYEEVTLTMDLKKVWATKSRFRGDRILSLSVDDIKSVCRENCPICGNMLDYGLGKNNHSKHDYNTPSIDQIIPKEAGGRYKKDNIWVICERCNRFKNSAYGAEDAARFSVIAKVIADPEYQKRLIDK